MPQRPSTPGTPAAPSVLEGGCLCGSVRYKVTGSALDRGSCHCRSCRKVSSAPELPYAQFVLTDFEVMRGWPATYHSSAEVTRSFCRHCGSPLTYRNAAHPDRLDIMTCSLDDPNALPPTHHVWTSHKQPNFPRRLSIRLAQSLRLWLAGAASATAPVH